MKRILLLTALTGALASQAFAFEVNIGRDVNYSTSPGGEFTVTAANPPDAAFDAVFNNYAAVATLNGGFQSFCLSLTTELLGNPQNATLLNSGLASGSAFLYSQFAHGDLPGYNYTPGAGRAASAAELQAAIWFFQGSTQTAIDSLAGFSTFDPATDTFVQDAVTHIGSLSAAQALDGGFGVEQLHLALGDRASQPMLALVSVPDGASTVMLLGFALSGLGIVARKMRS